MKTFTCNICNEYSTCNATSFIKHTKAKHNLCSQVYYDTYLKEGNEGNCIVCSNKTKFININLGYKNTCSHTCGGILHRRNLKNNTEKHKEFVKKIKANLKQKHKNRTLEEKKIFREKISTTRKQSIAKMSVEERKKCFGWLNNLSFYSKQEFISNVLTKTGAHAWWKNATLEEKNAVYNKRATTKRNKTTRDIKNSFKQYRAEVDYLTKQTYKKYKKYINPQNFKRGSKPGLYHIDHKYSVYEGFKNCIPCEVISCRFNLQMLEYGINLNKSTKCSITKYELIKLHEQHKT